MDRELNEIKKYIYEQNDNINIEVEITKKELNKNSIAEEHNDWVEKLTEGVQHYIKTHRGKN